MTEAIIPRRDQQFPFHGSWRENVYPIPQLGATRQHFPRKTNADKTKDRKKSVLGSNHDHNQKNEKQNPRSVASDRAYKAYAHHEIKKDPKEVKEKRKVFRKPYDSNGPNDDRYYVSASSGIGTDQSQADTESGRQDQPNVFVKLLHHQVLHYSSKGSKSGNNTNNENMTNNKEKSERKHSSRSSKHSEGSSRPPSPKPDYFEGKKSKLSREKKLVSKSISNLLVEKNETFISSKRNLSASSLQLSPSIPIPDYEKDNLENKNRRPKERDVWSNANRFRGSQNMLDMNIEELKGSKLARGQIMPTETLKQVMKTRPPISEVVKEITKVSEKDKIRQQQRENMQKEAESIFNKEKDEIDLHKMNQKEKKRPKNSVESSSEEDEAKKIYREILEVVKTNAPASLQYGRGRMVGYGEEAQDTLRRGDKKNAVRSRSEKFNNHNAFTRMRQSEDRESVTTSIDSYPFSPSSPWAHALPSRYNRFGYPVFPQRSFGLASPSGPVSFAGFSSPPSQLTTSSLGPGSLHHHIQQPRRGKPKRKKKWFNIF